MKYTSTDRKQLRGLAHSLKPIVQIGKNGLTDSVINSITVALLDHELIKIKFIDNKDVKKQVAEEIAIKCDALLAGLIGNMAIFYKQQPDKEKRTITLSENNA